MNLNEEKEQSQNVESKYLDPEKGIEIDLRRDRLYNIRKTTKIVKPSKVTQASSFEQLDHYSKIGYVFDNFEEDSFLTDDYLDEILVETEMDGEDTGDTIDD